MRDMKYYLLLALLITGLINLSCSKNSTGTADLDIDFPNTAGNHWTYEINRVMEAELDTVDVDIFLRVITGNDVFTLWSFDYHCVLDTAYIIIGIDTVDSIITCIPPPDTSMVIIKADSVTLSGESFFSFDKFVMRFPLSDNKSWNWVGNQSVLDKHTNEVIDISTKTVKGETYNNVYIIKGYHEVGSFGSDVDFIRSEYWFVHGIGLIKVIENKIKIIYESNVPLEQIVEIISWELMDYTLTD